MRNRIPILCVLLSVSGVAQTPFVRSEGAAVTIEVDAAKKAGYQIPRTIYGTFLEPIGNSIYGGLWAQILENPSFEDNLWSASQVKGMLERNPELVRSSNFGLPLPWEPLYPDQGMRYEPRWGDAANSARSLLVMALPGKQSGVRQEVYLPVHRVLEYTGSFYAKHVSGPAEVEVSLRKRGQPENVLSRANVPLNGNGWARYEFKLSLDRDKLTRLEPADFALAVADESRVLLDQVFLVPADNVDGMDPDMVEMCRALKMPVVRYGGNFTSGYHWRDGIGPMDKRVSMLNQSWGMPEYNHFGTDELLTFCKRIGAEPQIALNLGSGTPEEAADWVRYVNERWGKKGLLWELGNELYGTWQIGYPTLERIAPLTAAYSKAVRGADPSARLIATGQDPDHFREWNRTQMSLEPGSFDYLSTHFVVGARVMKNDPSNEFTALSSFALPVGLERHLREMKQQIDNDPRWRGKAKIAFTEWLFHGPDNSVPTFGNMGGAICAAGLLNTLIRVADFTPISDMTGLIEFGGVWKKRGQVYGVPAYWAFRMYSTADATVPVETRTTGPAYDIERGNGRIQAIKDVPYLDVVSALNQRGDRLTLFCVNREMQRDLSATIRFAGFTPAEGKAQTLRGSSIHQPNDEMRPNGVRPRESAVEVRGTELPYLFPRASVTVLEFVKK